MLKRRFAKSYLVKYSSKPETIVDIVCYNKKRNLKKSRIIFYNGSYPLLFYYVFFKF